MSVTVATEASRVLRLCANVIVIDIGLITMISKSSDGMQMDLRAEDNPNASESGLTEKQAHQSQSTSQLTVNAGIAASSRLTTMTEFEMRAFLMIL